MIIAQKNAVAKPIDLEYLRWRAEVIKMAGDRDMYWEARRAFLLAQGESYIASRRGRGIHGDD